MERVPERIPTPPSPEHWVPRVEVPQSKEYFALQFRFAKKIAEKMDIPLLDAINSCAPSIKQNALLYTKERGLYFDEFLTDDEFVENAYESYLRNMRKDPVPYHEQNRFGCMSYTFDRSDASACIHFQNAEHGAKGPLSLENLPHRRAEVADVVRDIKRKHPYLTHMYGNSWLYNLKSYLRIYPQSYTEHLEPDETRAAWRQGSRIWGQFLSSEGEVDHERAALLLERIDALPEGAYMCDLLTPPLMLPLTATAPLENFYREYEVD